MGFLEKEEEKQSSFWDWVVGIGLVVLIGGFTVYYQYQKRSSISRGKQADSLFTAGKYVEAARVYEELKNAQYLTTKDDSLIYARLDTIETRTDEEVARVAEARSKLAQGDSAGAAGILATLRYRELLPPQDRDWVDSAMGKPTTTASP